MQGQRNTPASGRQEQQQQQVGFTLGSFKDFYPPTLRLPKKSGGPVGMHWPSAELEAQRPAAMAASPWNQASCFVAVAPWKNIHILLCPFPSSQALNVQRVDHHLSEMLQGFKKLFCWLNSS